MMILYWLNKITATYDRFNISVMIESISKEPYFYIELVEYGLHIPVLVSMAILLCLTVLVRLE
jgi:hypothetical protein